MKRKVIKQSIDHFGHNWNDNCPNIHCMGGVITYDGQTGRLCKKCNPDPRTKSSSRIKS